MCFAPHQLTLIEEDAILNACIDWTSTECKDRRTELKDYVGLYKEQLSQLDLVYGLGGERWPFAERKHTQLLDIVGKVRELGLTVTKNQARRAVESQLQHINMDAQTLDDLVDAAMRVWTLVNFRRPSDISVGKGRPCVEWTDDAELQTTLATQFKTSGTELTLGQRRLSPFFTVANMANICGLRIEWAATIDDHLSLDRHLKVLQIFPLRNWLNIMCEASGTSHGISGPAQTNQPTRTPRAPLPKELYEETSRTLDLLFPSWDKATQKYLKKRNQDFQSTYSRPRLLDLRHYSYWRDRLLELNEDIFLAPPEGWAQLWRDRRDPQKFWTFWIALLVLWLTMVATTVAIVQTWATLRQCKPPG